MEFGGVFPWFSPEIFGPTPNDCRPAAAHPQNPRRFAPDKLRAGHKMSWVTFLTADSSSPITKDQLNFLLSKFEFDSDTEKDVTQLHLG